MAPKIEAKVKQEAKIKQKSKVKQEGKLRGKPKLKQESKVRKKVQRKRVRQTITLELKYEILKLHDRGLKVHEIAKKFQFAHSTVSTIIGQKEKYKSVVKNAWPMSATLIRTKRNVLIGEMENQLIAWINKQTEKLHRPVGRTAISQKALSIFSKLKKDCTELEKQETFCASKGWFDRFRVRAGLHNIKTQAVAPNFNDESASFFQQNLKKVIAEEGYSSQHVFNIVQTSLCWKKLSSERNGISNDKEWEAINRKASKSRLNLLIGANAAGNCRLKPLVIYPSKNPRALKGMARRNLPVIWKYSPNSWITSTIFEDWLSHHFVREVKNFCSKQGIAHKYVIILNSSMNYMEELQHSHSNIKVISLPPFTNPLLQPMEQGIIKSFKETYMKKITDTILTKVTERNSVTEDEFMQLFDIKDAIEVIAESWNEIPDTHLNSVWKKLCPQFVKRDICSGSLPEFSDDELPLDSIVESEKDVKYSDFEENFSDIDDPFIELEDL